MQAWSVASRKRTVFVGAANVAGLNFEHPSHRAIKADTDAVFNPPLRALWLACPRTKRIRSMNDSSSRSLFEHTDSRFADLRKFWNRELQPSYAGFARERGAFAGAALKPEIQALREYVFANVAVSTRNDRGMRNPPC